MKNQDLREEITRARIKLYEIAEQLGITDCTFSRKLRHELSENDKTEIRTAIKKILESEAN